MVCIKFANVKHTNTNQRTSFSCTARLDQFDQNEYRNAAGGDRLRLVDCQTEPEYTHIDHWRIVIGVIGRWTCCDHLSGEFGKY